MLISDDADVEKLIADIRARITQQRTDIQRLQRIVARRVLQTQPLTKPSNP